MIRRTVGVIALVGLSLPTSVLSAEPAVPDVEATRRVVGAVVAEAQRLARAGTPRLEEHLTDLYIRAAAAEAARLPRDKAVPAFLAALGIALDDSTLVRSNLIFGPFCRKVESDAARTERLRLLGGPSLRHRRDWCQHFAVSCTLTALA